MEGGRIPYSGEDGTFWARDNIKNLDRDGIKLQIKRITTEITKRGIEPHSNTSNIPTIPASEEDQLDVEHEIEEFIKSMEADEEEEIIPPTNPISSVRKQNISNKVSSTPVIQGEDIITPQLIGIPDDRRSVVSSNEAPNLISTPGIVTIHILLSLTSHVK